MKIPDGNNGAYYGNEEGGQWQQNGVVAGGDAGYHRYPPQGYVMPGAYYDGSSRQMDAHDDFSEYMWMENEEEFDKQVMQQLEEEALMEQCIEAMLEDEQRERNRPQNGHPQTPESRLSLEQAVSRSTLNPLAAEFVPTFVRQAVITQEPEAPPETPGDTPTDKTENTVDAKPDNIEESTTTDLEEKQPTIQESVEVSTLEEDSKPKSEGRKSKSDTRKKVQASKSEPKMLSPVTTEVEVTSKSCDRQNVNERMAEAQKEVKVEPTPVEDTTPCGPKPINYAAAAKANKPKKATTPPVVVQEKQAPIKVDKQKSVEKIKEKVKVDAKRKNSGK